MYHGFLKDLSANQKELSHYLLHFSLEDHITQAPINYKIDYV